MWPVQAQRGCWQGQDWRMRVGHRVCQGFLKPWTCVKAGCQGRLGNMKPLAKVCKGVHCT